MVPSIFTEFHIKKASYTHAPVTKSKKYFFIVSGAGVYETSFDARLSKNIGHHGWVTYKERFSNHTG